APVYGGDQPMNQKQAAKTQKKSKSRKTTPSKQIVKTQPLKEFSEIKPEPLPLSESPTSEPITLESQQSALPTPPAAQEQQEPSLTTSPVVSEAPKSSPPPPPAELTPFEPIEATVPLSPAVGALVSAANQNTKSGDLDSAAVSIERAIRIEPRNATLFYKLALLRLKQSKPRLAEDLAKKSALLASTDNALKKHCWLLIAHARELQQDFAGAKEARAKADNF
ncbi:MAG TPA: tetratricopeptide repeat protein, partial [Methylobacter sp.]